MDFFKAVKFLAQQQENINTQKWEVQMKWEVKLNLI